MLLHNQWFLMYFLHNHLKQRRQVYILDVLKPLLLDVLLWLSLHSQLWYFYVHGRIHHCKWNSSLEVCFRYNVQDSHLVRRKYSSVEVLLQLSEHLMKLHRHQNALYLCCRVNVTDNGKIIIFLTHLFNLLYIDHMSHWTICLLVWHDHCTVWI